MLALCTGSATLTFIYTINPTWTDVLNRSHGTDRCRLYTSIKWLPTQIQKNEILFHCFEFVLIAALWGAVSAPVRSMTSF